MNSGTASGSFMARVLCANILLVMVVMISGCRSSPPQASAMTEGPITYPGLEWLTDADPFRDLAMAWGRGDRRFIGVYGFSAYTPGVPQNAADMVKSSGVRYLQGTSDALENDEHARAVARATDYARRYNTALLEKLHNAK